MPLLLLIVFIVVPIVELYVIIQVGQAIGVVPTLFLLLLSAVLGTFLLRTQGRAVWRRFNEALNERRVPHREVLDGVLVIFGGALLLTPGFVTDIVGILFLLPPSRAGIRGFLSKLFIGRVALSGRAAYWGYNRVRGRRGSSGERTGGAAAGAGPGPGSAGPPPRRPSRDYDVEGEAHEVRDESLLDRPSDSER
jgi:UPF0716 protein FxsA